MFPSDNLQMDHLQQFKKYSVNDTNFKLQNIDFAFLQFVFLCQI